MSAKAALKAAKSALDAGDYETTIKEAQAALASDPKNYFAQLFCGRAFEKQGKVNDAANGYRSAANLKPDDSQAWLGLCSLYEAQGSQKVDEYREAAVKTAEIFANGDDIHRCQTAIDKLTSFTRQWGTKSQQKRTLEVLLPKSPVFDYLEGRIPHPSHTYMRLAEITEDEEAQTVKQEIATRRTRIGARVGQVTAEVKREVFGRSDLENLYQQTIDWSTDDEVRRQYEERLLQRAHAVLVVLPPDQKASKLDHVLTLAEGMVIIHHPFKMAWDLVLETRDLEDLREMDAHILREYVTFFPDSGLGRILEGWLSSELSPFPAPPAESESEGTKEPPKQISTEDRLLQLTEGLVKAEESPLAYRLVGDYYLHLEEHESAVETARLGLKSLTNEAAKLGMTMRNTKDAINSVLATALVHYQAPRNHAEARRLFEDILQRKPKWTAALIGLGLIFEENEQYNNAVTFLSRALEEAPENVRVGTELAWCRALAGNYEDARQQLEEYLPNLKVDEPRARDLRAQVIYRIGVCIWSSDTSKQARKDRNGAYSRFLTAIKTNVNFAPAYASLGVYYADYSKDKKRARQCFQKAFELSPSETGAAERLARLYADQGDWDIVEVISQRVIDTGRARPPPGSKRKGLSWPYSALGVVQMNKQEYQKAITSFLAALRISPDDYQSYVGLGESYHNSGRYNSALRTFNYALEPSDNVKMHVTGETWFARYMLANVQRELGEHEEAVKGLRSVLEERPAEFGVSISLLQTYIEQSWRCVEGGLFGQAVDNASQAIELAVSITKMAPRAFNVWKAVGDACLFLSWVQSGIVDVPLEKLQTLLAVPSDTSPFQYLQNIDNVFLEKLELSDKSTSTDIVYAGLLAYKRSIDACSDDLHAQAVAWYNLGWAEHRAHICMPAKAGRIYLKAAVRAFKRAIELEAGNAEFWNALGVVTSTLNPKVAQHSFVRSLHLNELNAKVWTNLGVLYLLHNDNELAHQAFGRSQSTDPDYAHAWLGDGLIALLLGDRREALGHFIHAFEIADSSSLFSKRQYALSTFDHLLTAPAASSDLTALIQPIFALSQLYRQAPSIHACNHLSALFAERAGAYATAIATLTSLCEISESEYETTEALDSLARFAHAKTDLSRCQLSNRNFPPAAENAQIALDLTTDADASGLDADTRTTLRLSAHLTAGLAAYYLKDHTASIAAFRSALQESNNDAEVVCALVQVLWAHGGSEERSVAREQLFSCVEGSGAEHARAVTLLGALAALEGDQDTCAAVRDDLVELRTKDGVSIAEQAHIEDLLAALALLDKDSARNEKEATLAEVQAAIMLSPNQPLAWTKLAELSGETFAAKMALQTARKAVPPFGDMQAEELAGAFAGVGTPADAQRAIFTAPWEGCGWTGLADTVSA